MVHASLLSDQPGTKIPNVLLTMGGFIGSTSSPVVQQRYPFTSLFGLSFGSRGWGRTNDILINSQAQLPLCYSGKLSILILPYLVDKVNSYFGAQRWNRTTDSALMRRILYH